MNGNETYLRLKDIMDSPCGMRYMVDGLELQSGFARRFLLDMPMMTSGEDIRESYKLLRSFYDSLDKADKTSLNTLQFKLQSLKDIRKTVKRLSDSSTLDDIELFEIKHLSLLAGEVSEQMTACGMKGIVDIPDLSEAVSILDPDGLKISTFYVYDSYSERLRELRSSIRKSPDLQEHLIIEANEIEESVRKDLCRQLQLHVEKIQNALTAIALVDINLAKALQMKKTGLSFPDIAKDVTNYSNLFNPQVKETLASMGKAFQPVNVSFGQEPTVITGANMGGKTVVLKTLTLCQYLFQFGFGIPAATASVKVVDKIFFCIGDEQSIEKGLSSFAAEMKSIDAVIKESRKNGKVVALIDEPARTTNPVEGTALVSALLQVLSGKNVNLVLSTHYNIDSYNAHCLRVKGFENGEMNYQLVETYYGDVPHEAFTIAESLGIDKEWIAKAREIEESNSRLRQDDID